MTRQNPVVGVSEAVTLLFLFISAKALFAYSIFLYDTGMNAAWFVPIIQTAIGFAGVLLLFTLLNKYPGKDIIKIGEKLTGPYVNILLSLFYLSVFIFSSGITLRLISEQVVTGFFIDTPISFVMFSFLSGSLVVSYLGLEAVARTARFLVSIVVISVVVLILLTIPFWEFHTLFPLLGAGVPGIFKGAVLNSGVFVQILLLGIIAPFLPGNSLKGIGLWGVAAAGFFLFLWVLVPLLVFTYPAVSEMTLPYFEMSKTISIGRFGQRAELLFFPIWVFGSLILISVSLYSGAAVITRLLDLEDYRPFVLAAAVFSLVIALLPQNVPQVLELNQRYLNQLSFPVLIIILGILLGASRLYNKGGTNNQKRN